MSDKPLPLYAGDVVAAIRAIARWHGYAVAVHGSMRPERDLDLMAMPWVAWAHSYRTLRNDITASLPYLYRVVRHDNDRPKAHGRQVAVWVIQGHRHASCPRYVDLSVGPLLY